MKAMKSAPTWSPLSAPWCSTSACCFACKKKGCKKAQSMMDSQGEGGKSGARSSQPFVEGIRLAPNEAAVNEPRANY
jgi:hypothetical protein